MTQKLFAFWSKPEFPYLLGGEIDYIQPNGKVRMGGNWSHMTVQARLLLPEEEGKKLLKKLGQLENEYIKATRYLLEEFRLKRNQELKPYEGFWYED